MPGSSLLHISFIPSSGSTIGPTGSVEMNTSVPIQNLRLVQYRVKFSADADAQAIDVLGINLPFQGYHDVNNTTANNSAIPLLIGNTALTLQSVDMDMGVHKEVPRKFNYEILNNVTNSRIATTDNIERIDLIFQYDLRKSV